MTAKITVLKRYCKKGEPGEVLQEAKLLAGLGMEGNLHQGGERQICLNTQEIRDWMDSLEEKGLCFKRFKENILIEGIPSGKLPHGIQLRVGEAVLQLNPNSKDCHDECRLYSQEVKCCLSECAVFAIVEFSGVVRVGDSVSFS